MDKNPPLAAVILAAGQGTRMKSDFPKVAHRIGGRPLVAYPARMARDLGCSPTVLVVGHGAEEVKSAVGEPDLRYALQSEQLGTGHALMAARETLDDFSGDLLLLCGDVPLLRASTLERLIRYHAEQVAALTVLTAEVSDPHGYGRIVREGEEILRIVEEKDASASEKTIREINTGIYVFRAPLVFELLESIGRDNSQGEYYLTDVVEAARARGHNVRALPAADEEEILGINDRVQLARAADILRGRINEELMRSGVTLEDPSASYIEAGVRIGRDTVVQPGVHLRGKTTIGEGCLIEPGVVVTDCIIGNSVHLKAGSVLQGAEVGESSMVGPMAHLRPGTVLKGRNKVGNFVETKKAIIGLGSKSSHLTYIGDAEVGADVNIGCGTITCNYDGVNKHKTIIEDGVFVGSDTQFVAPVRIGRNSLIGAGSTITKDVPPDSLAVSRSPQVVREGWTLRKKKK